MKTKYSRVLNNRRGWNNMGGGGLDIVIIINNRGGWNNRGIGRARKNSVGGFLGLIC